MSGTEKIIPVAASVVIIVLVAMLEERSREMAAIAAVMPLTVPLAVWIVFSGSGGSHQQTAEFVRSMFTAYVPTLIFIAALWYGFRQAWSFPLVIVVAFAAWAGLVALPYVVRRFS